MTIGRFLAGIAALVRDPATGEYLLLKRAGAKDYGAGEWECVTGRLDQGEGFEDALHRELAEELGVRGRLEFIVGTTHFYRGEETPDNELVGVVYACAVDDRNGIRVSEEHSEHRWLTAAAALAFLPEGNWLRRVIEHAEQIRSQLSPDLVVLFEARGFELG